MKVKRMIGGVCISLFLFMILAPLARSENGRDYEYFLEQGGPYAKVINYLRSERGSLEPLNFSLNRYLGLTLIDALLFAFCLWLALLLLGRGSIIGKEYIWLILGFNLLWLVCLAVFQFGWGALSFLLLGMRPDYKPVIVDTLTLGALITGVVIYVWLLARIFRLSFYGAAGTFVFSHLVYALLVIVFLTVTPAQTQLADLVRSNFGAEQILHNYLRDMARVTTGENIFFPLRIRAVHF